MKRMKHSVILAALGLACGLGGSAWGDVLRLGALDLSGITQEWGTPQADKSVGGHGISIGGTKFEHGVGTHAASEWVIDLHKSATRFTAKVGLDDEEPDARASVRFKVLGDGKTLWQSKRLRSDSGPQAVDVDVTGVSFLCLIVEPGGESINYDHADWAEAEITYSGQVPANVVPVHEEPVILTPAAGPAPRINGAAVFGVRPGSPILYTVAATGTRPLTFAAEGLPEGAAFDAATGRISGAVSTPGTYHVKLTATNAVGSATRDFKLVVGDKISLTPPMGWNSWNCFAHAVTGDNIKSAADAMVSSGLIDHGWTYVNVDDFWQNHASTKDPTLSGKERDANGVIVPNSRFPDMKALADYIHGKGLKAGLYSSPGHLTCGGCYASYEHEALDADTYASWGFDYLKYDWCSYGKVYDELKKSGKLTSELDGQKAPYILMGNELRRQKRDILFSLCQYGMADVWNWGESVNGNCWRCTGDIVDTWGSLSSIGFGKSMVAAAEHAAPGAWNDPDMLIVGHVGWGHLHPTRLTPNEQYTHISLWCLDAAPLLIGCDMTKLDAFTLGLLTNDEVLAVDQDELGQAARQIKNVDLKQTWARKLSDGSIAVGLFNTGYLPQTIEVDFAEVGAPGKVTVRDLWRQKDAGEFEGKYSVEVPRHGCALLKLTPH